MKRAFIKLLHFLVPTKVYREKKRRYLLEHLAPLRVIEHPEDCFESVYHIKDETWEAFPMAEIFDVAKQTTIKLHHQAQDILCVNDAHIIPDSDIVVTDQGVLWDKYYTYNFDESIIPWDADLLSKKRNEVQVHRSMSRQQTIEGGCVSLLGVFVQVWAHFMLQFVCKLYYAEEAGLLDNNTTLLVPNNMDANMKEIVENVISRHPNLKCEVAQNGTEYICQKLFYIQSACVYHNQCINFNHGQIIVPKTAVDTIQKYLVKPYVDKIDKKNPKHEKVFLIRRNTTRSLVNNDEVEEYFRKEGFFFMEGANYSLREKAEIFRNAKIIVGPQGTAFTNTIFCNKAKCLIFVNAAHVMENALFALSYPQVTRCIHVTGEDTSSHYDCTVYIPIDKIKRAYKELLKDE